MNFQWNLLLFFFSISLCSPALAKDFTIKKTTSPQATIKPFPSIYNDEVSNWIYFFLQSQNSHYIKTWLKRSYRYFPLMKKILNQQNLPEELVYMTLVESSLSPRAISSAQAVGYWQFIQPTALRFGLQIKPWIDERRDFERSTQAASLYLSELYTLFDDWLLAMSAYNMGEDRLNKLIKKYDSRNFWALSKKHDFPKETSKYIPKILASMSIMKNPERYGHNRFSILTPYKYDIFYAPGGTDLQKLCKEMKLSYANLKKLNPQLKRSVIPRSVYQYKLRIPKGDGIKISKWLSQQNPL